ncbi:C-type lectin domain family 2 member B-like [Notechis scutatus]|uniref:C-type lectin domain family 2 member B-like n=1 Tax=Notechis scutatus TaxID=8663 RepID=A0A6J1W173_9SAUR|nr:C-type lectin domain family 2 member B-like [Notechis scutatus]
MLNMDVKNQLLGPPPNGCTSEQEKEPARVKAIQLKLWSICDRHKKTIIGVGIISHLILSSILFFLGTLMPLKHQQEAFDCPPDWISYWEHCYKLSREEKNWKESQNFCILHNASLAKITEEEMDFMRMLTRDHVFWIGLKREPNQPWKWLDGENSTLEATGNGGDCVYLDDGATASSGKCTTEHRYICKKKLSQAHSVRESIL